MTRFRPILALGVAGALLYATAAQALSLPGQLNAVDVRTRIVGHSVVNSDKTMTWWYAADGTFEGDSGRAHSGRFTVRDDGQLCWKESDGTAGCFVYIQTGKQLSLRRVDAGRDDDLGPVTIGKGN